MKIKARDLLWVGLAALTVFLAGAVWVNVSRQELDAAPGGTNPTSEARQIQQMAENGNENELAEFLESCTVTVPAGKFIMGTDNGPADERPAHAVYLDEFKIDRYEVTNAQYRQFVLATGHNAPIYWEGGNYPGGQSAVPVVGIGWGDAEAYCAWRGERLLTEAQWEKACRGEDGRLYPWGNEWDISRANVDPNPGSFLGLNGTDDAWSALTNVLKTVPVKGQAGLWPVWRFINDASPYGVIGMAGGTYEWVADYYNWNDYSGLPDRNPLNLEPPWNRVLRGGSWFEPYAGPTVVALESRCSARNSSHNASDLRAGFRCGK